jgi:hypothetical protein
MLRVRSIVLPVVYLRELQPGLLCLSSRAHFLLYYLVPVMSPSKSRLIRIVVV